MGASDLLKNGSVDVDSARADRMNRENPPEYAPGQDDGFDFFDDSFGSDGGGVGNSFSSDSLGGAFDGFDSGFGGGGFGAGGSITPVTPQEPIKSDEDKFFDALVKVAKGGWEFSKDVVSSFSGLNSKFWASWGSRTCVVGLAVGVVGLVSWLFQLKVGLHVAIGGFLSCATGVVVLMCNVENAKTCPDAFEGTDAPTEGTSVPQDTFNGFTEDGGYDDYDDYGADDDFGGFDDFGDDYDVFDAAGASNTSSDVGFQDSDFDMGEFDKLNLNDAPVAELMSTDEALESLPEVKNGMFTRQYLFEMLNKRLPEVKKDFSKVTPIDEGSDVFIAWEKYLRDAAEVHGVKEDNLPTLLKLEENLLTIRLTCTRVTGCKPESLADELARIYAYTGTEFNSKVYGTADVVGKECYITIFTGKRDMVSLKDMYGEVEDYVLDTHHYMPVVIGYDAAGKAVVCDFKMVESIIVAGKPRMGKSWVVQSILLQMCAYVPPSEMHLYFCDAKEDSSDFKPFNLPHVKKFVSSDDEIVKMLRDLVRKEGPRRKKILGAADTRNIWDFKEKCPDVKMPLIYIVIDEVLTLAERMSKEVKDEFQSLLREVLSQLPNLGVRLFLIPHVVKHDIISKTATQLIDCRISVRGDAEHIESTTGAKPKDFRYKLSEVGDMAAKISSLGEAVEYIHGGVLTPTNVGNADLFDYMRRAWAKLEPEEVADSIARFADSKLDVNKLLSEKMDSGDGLSFDDLDNASKVTVDVPDNADKNGVVSSKAKDSFFMSQADGDDGFGSFSEDFGSSSSSNAGYDSFDDYDDYGDFSDYDTADDSHAGGGSDNLNKSGTDDIFGLF